MIQTAQLILALSILVVLHELGHFIPAKLFKMRVNKFYLFFDPWFSLLKIKKGDTEYGIGWLPLGGYVKIAGMIDESMDTKQMELPPQPWEFRSKPAWQRLVTMLGGVTVNLILGYIIFSCILYSYGEEYIPLKNLKNGVYVEPVLQKLGFKNGDQILKIGSKTITEEEAIQDLSWAVLMREVDNVTVLRDQKEIVVHIPTDISNQLLANKEPILFQTPYPFQVDSLVLNGNAYKAGVKKNDRIVAVNDTITKSYFHATDLIQKCKGKNIELSIIRDGIPQKIKTHVSSEGKIGVWAKSNWEHLYQSKTKKYGFFESFGKGFGFTADIFGKNVSQLKLLFNSNGVQHVGSVLSMREQFSEKWNWLVFWMLTANLSLILAFFNILPIPGLDGGHAIITLAEMITGKKPSKKFLEVTQTIGMLLLLSLMIFALGNDIYNGKL